MVHRRAREPSGIARSRESTEGRKPGSPLSLREPASIRSIVEERTPASGKAKSEIVALPEIVIEAFSWTRAPDPASTL